MLRIDRHPLPYGDTAQANMPEEKCIRNTYSEDYKRTLERQGRVEG